RGEGNGAPRRICQEMDSEIRHATSSGYNAHREVSRSLVLRKAGVDLVAPGENATFHVANMLKAGLPEDTAGLRAADSALAVDHDVGFLIELVQMLGHGRQRDQVCAGNARNPVLVRLPNIDEYEVVAAVQLFFYFPDFDFAFVHLRLLGGNSAELLIIDELGDGTVFAADGALRIFAQFELSEPHAEGVIEEKTSHERLTDPEYELHRFRGLDQPDGSRQNAKHAALGATRNQPRRWRLGIEAAVARAAFIGEHRGLALEAEY